MSVTVSANDGCGITLRAQAEMADFSQQFGGGQFLPSANCLLDDGKQFAL
jgi:hypothetical protein